MNKASNIVFNKSDFRTPEEFYSVLFQQIKALIENRQLFTFHENPTIRGIYVLQFGPSEITEDTLFPVWLDAEEIASVTTFNQLRDYQDAKEFVENFENPKDIDDDFGVTPKKKKDDGDYDA